MDQSAALSTLDARAAKAEARLEALEQQLKVRCHLGTCRLEPCILPSRHVPPQAGWRCVRVAPARVHPVTQAE